MKIEMIFSTFYFIPSTISSKNPLLLLPGDPPTDTPEAPYFLQVLKVAGYQTFYSFFFIRYSEHDWRGADGNENHGPAGRLNSCGPSPKAGGTSMRFVELDALRFYPIDRGQRIFLANGPETE